MHKTCIAISHYACFVSIPLMKKWRVVFGIEVYVSTIQHFIWDDRMVSASLHILVATNYVKTTEETLIV